jgi:hypothetical protein
MPERLEEALRLLKTICTIPHCQDVRPNAEAAIKLIQAEIERLKNLKTGNDQLKYEAYSLRKDWQPLPVPPVDGKGGAVMAQRLTPLQADAVYCFVNKILHGDSKHRRWLIEAAAKFCEGEPIPKEPEEGDRE